MKIKSILFIFMCFLQFYSAQNGVFTELEHICIDQIQRPYIIYTPNLKKEKRPLLIYLHGAISSPNIKENPLEYIKKSKLISIADKFNFNIMFSYGQKNATWYDTVGTSMVLNELNQVIKKIPIDIDKIFLAGFSDGGSGVYNFAMNYNDNFAGFIALNGSIKIADKLSEHSIYPENMNNKPLLIVNTTKDALYPIGQMKSSVDYLQKFNPNISFLTFEGNHEMSYLQDYPNIIGNFITNHALKKVKKLSLEGNEESPKIGWLKITKLDTISTSKTFHLPYKYKVFNDKAYIGIKLDYTYQGEGLKVKGFKKNHHTAKNIGIKKGDIILKMDNMKMNSPYSPFMYRATKKAEDSLNVLVLRDHKEIILSGKFDKGYDYLLFSHPKHSGKINSIIKNKTLIIHTSKVKNFQIDYSKIETRIKHIIINGNKRKVKRHEKNKCIDYSS